ncbi:MAG: hypothetical protein JXB30_07880 [Anaerolineae bacterium]|nr:hypothetical protein [Anaerolineae bacterium]
MLTSMLEQIEANIAQLSLNEQLWLMERLAYHIRRHTLPTIKVKESELAAMAADPAIQHEIQQIGAEFAVAEMDGLGAEQ